MIDSYEASTYTSTIPLRLSTKSPCQKNYSRKKNSSHSSSLEIIPERNVSREIGYCKRKELKEEGIEPTVTEAAGVTARCPTIGSISFVKLRG